MPTNSKQSGVLALLLLPCQYCNTSRAAFSAKEIDADPCQAVKESRSPKLCRLRPEFWVLAWQVADAMPAADKQG